MIQINPAQRRPDRGTAAHAFHSATAARGYRNDPAFLIEPLALWRLAPRTHRAGL
jgi:hypothetical protein